MGREPNNPDDEAEAADEALRRALASGLARPSVRFRRRAWLAFQRALDPLAKPRPLRPPRH